MIPADSTPTNTTIRNNRWSQTHVGTDGAATTWFGAGSVPGVNVEGFHVSKPLAARKRGRGLGASKRRARQARAKRQAST